MKRFITLLCVSVLFVVCNSPVLAQQSPQETLQEELDELKVQIEELRADLESIQLIPGPPGPQGPAGPACDCGQKDINSARGVKISGVSDELVLQLGPRGFVVTDIMVTAQGGPGLMAPKFPYFALAWGTTGAARFSYTSSSILDFGESMGITVNLKSGIRYWPNESIYFRGDEDVTFGVTISGYYTDD